MVRTEQRAAPRHEIRFELMFSDNGSPTAGWVRNLSRTGMLLETERPLPPGTVIIISSLELLGDSHIELPARVVRLEPLGGAAVGMGVSFENLDDHGAALLGQLLDERALNAS